MKTKRTQLYLAAALSALGWLAPAPVNAFKIDFFTTFVPFGDISHIGMPIHEEITRDALTNVTPSVRSGVIVNLQRGVQNTDVIHMFDSESHFDNASVFLNRGFSNGFMTITQRMASARRNALRNPEFLDPHYTSFRDISADVAVALALLATDPECLLQPACPTTRAAADAGLISSFLPALALNPNPDPHRPTHPRSLFRYPPDPTCQSAGLGLCGYFGLIQEGYLQILDKVEDVVDDALGDHFDPFCPCDRDLEDVMGSSNSHVVRLKRLKNAIRAYSAYQNLGHALHAAQDFFAHSDYVELMAGVAIGQAITPGTAIPLPADFSQFNLPSLQVLMGAARFNQLESGDVFTIWLGEGDYSLGDAGIFNPFNADSESGVGGFELFDIEIPRVPIPAIGQNPNPFPGFNHGHYLSSTTLGLNKDSPFASPTDEPAHRNFLPARQAAVHVSGLLWKSFLESIGEISLPVHVACPANKTVPTAPGQCYATVALGTPGVSGGCSPPSVTNDAPAQFLKGTNIVHWTATDECGNTARCNQIVVVVDRELPRITCSTNRVAAATTSRGAIVVFPAPAATDNCPGVTVRCAPPAGSTFPIGTTTVRCTASDASANQAACSFTIRVKGAAEQMRDQITLLNRSSLPLGTRNSLVAKLKSALTALSAGDTATACISLQSFINGVNAQSGKMVPVSQATALVAAARQIKTVLNCP